MKSHLLTWIAVAGLALASSAKADIFTYDIQSVFIVPNPTDLHVRFELSSFEQNVVNQTVFDIATWGSGTVTSFSIDGDVPLPHLSFTATGGPTSSLSSSLVPFFNGPGTFTVTLAQFNESTTVTITDVPSSVPEPSAWSLLSVALLGAGLLARKRRPRPSRQS